MNDVFFDGFKPRIIEKTATKQQAESSDSILDLAHAFLAIESMTHKKLQKLCYYAKAWYLAINNENLISEDFEAWVHGAVQPRLYQEYRNFGFSYIPKYNSSSPILEEFINFAKEIFDSYGEFSGDELEKINHQELPWLNARQDLKPWQNSNNIISEDDMKEYFRGLMENE